MFIIISTYDSLKKTLNEFCPNEIEISLNQGKAWLVNIGYQSSHLNPQIDEHTTLCCSSSLVITYAHKTQGWYGKLMYIITVTSQWGRRRFKSPASRLFTQPFILWRWKKTWKLRITGLCVGNSPVIGEFPAQIVSNAENVSIWWRHHEKIILFHACHITFVAAALSKPLYLKTCVANKTTCPYAKFIALCQKHRGSNQ